MKRIDSYGQKMWSAFLQLLRCSGCVCMFIVVLFLILSVLFFVFCTSVRMDWVGANVPRSFVSHMILDADGRHCMSFEFFDYREPDGQYVLRVFDICSQQKFRSLSHVRVQKFSKDGTVLFNGLLAFSGDRRKIGGKFVAMSPLCAPVCEGEVLVLDFYVKEEESETERLLSHIALTAKKVRYIKITA